MQPDLTMFSECAHKVLNTPSVNKKRVAANFSRAANTYDSAATLQQLVAARAMLGLSPELKPERILDLGSGTGSQTAVIASKYPEAHVTGLDLAMGMLQFARDRAGSGSWCSGDIESLPFQSGSFDLIFSSLAIQWCDLNKVLAEVHRVLKPGGQFVFSSLAKGTMVELHDAWQRIDGHDHVNGFDSFETQRSKVLNSPLSVGSLTLQKETIFYPSVIKLLREMKALGVNTVHSAQPGLMTRSRLQSLQQSYETFREEEGLPLSYQVLYGILNSPERYTAPSEKKWPELTL